MGVYACHAHMYVMAILGQYALCMFITKQKWVMISPDAYVLTFYHHFSLPHDTKTKQSTT